MVGRARCALQIGGLTDWRIGGLHPTGGSSRQSGIRQSVNPSIRLGNSRTGPDRWRERAHALDFCPTPSRSQMDEKQLAKLIRKNAALAEKLSKGRSGKNYNNTLPPKPEDDSADVDREHFFKEMKRREF